MELLISVDGTIITLVRMLTFLKTTPLHEYCAELYGMLNLTPSVMFCRLPLSSLGTAEVSQEQLSWALLCLVSPSCVHTKQKLTLKRT